MVTQTRCFFMFCFMLGTIALITPRAEAFTGDSYESHEQECPDSQFEPRGKVREVLIYYPQFQKREHNESSLQERVRFSARGGRRDRARRSPIGRTNYYHRPTSPSRENHSSVPMRSTPGRYVGTPDTIYGVASWYGREFHGRRTANGEVYNMHADTAAHRSLPFGTVVRVTNLRNGRQAVIRINDRGPFVAGREIDLSYGVARDLEMLETGVEKVRLDILTS